MVCKPGNCPIGYLIGIKAKVGKPVDCANGRSRKSTQIHLIVLIFKNDRLVYSLDRVERVCRGFGPG